LPADFQGGNTEIKKKADDQVAAARNLLTKPNEKAKEILKAVASKLKLIWVKDIIKENEKNQKNFNRSINGGILAGRTTADDEENSRMQITRIAKVENDNNPEPMDRAGVLAVLGDIGTAIFDCDPNFCKDETVPKCQEKKAKEEKKTIEGYCNVSKAIAKTLNVKFNDLLAMGAKAKKERGGSAIAPRKKGGPNGAERGSDNTKMGTPRSGLLTQTVDKSGFSAIWPWQLIPKKYMENCPEPWAGHYSGSIVEVLFDLDLFTKANSSVGGDDPLKSFEGKSMLEMKIEDAKQH